MKGKRHYFDQKPEKCPVCGSDRIADVIYGLINTRNNEISDRQDRGLVRLAGCVVNLEDAPSWECAGCGTRLYDNSTFHS